MNSNDPQTQCRFGKYVNEILQVYKELTIWNSLEYYMYSNGLSKFEIPFEQWM